MKTTVYASANRVEIYITDFYYSYGLAHKYKRFKVKIYTNGSFIREDTYKMFGYYAVYRIYGLDASSTYLFEFYFDEFDDGNWFKFHEETVTTVAPLITVPTMTPQPYHTESTITSIRYGVSNQQSNVYFNPQYCDMDGNIISNFDYYYFHNKQYKVRVYPISKNTSGKNYGEFVASTLTIPKFQWDTPKVKGEPFSLTAEEWNKFREANEVLADYISKLLTISMHFGSLVYWANYPQAYTGDKITRDIVYNMAHRYSEVKKNVYNLPYVHPSLSSGIRKGYPITADILNTLVDEYNKLVDIV